VLCERFSLHIVVLNFSPENISISCATAGGKRAPERKSQPSAKRISIHLKMKIKMIRIYEVGQVSLQLRVNLA
jgi:hypothetical protein